ncbi:unnamed protein product [Mycena citricolor]|uniref:Kinesin motor domain-containing protein n=1 Tax=Mycena citricolor TaxID=2018698 RepID=A0AAD2K402_9AGAR|nr:unnamed protein product [Mycena citricolor]
MASRRPPSRAKPTAAPQPPPRSKSVLGKSASTEAETNIQVVVRCRRRSEREIIENSPIIVSSNGAKSKEITIETAPPSTGLGVVTLPPVRTYPFDLVFGPEADQAMIYHEVVAPMLEEVVTGYNCTLFAYGQTGTGKTHTMQGDLVPTPLGNPSANAGMIPRVLFRLFHQLESSGSDFSVKISYVELYNEELRDLLATELSAPSGSVQPMGHGKDQKGSEALKIFDDASKNGVLIQGLEEVGVKDSADALALLVKGSERRQIAATRFNDHSSRSHSVFSITVHTKETGLVGEDLLRTGKLNLVDLAGSENIGRSGAENKRAREAGMINQSLLTLGRVINALVDRSSHVPYRESKLTRLLQDSLGGRTKTCIVATVSPSRSNMEETLSTLDYALRAKSIRNKPELNQRMTRNSLLKEYVAEIERLKADVLAAREKNGIILSEESWAQLTAEQEMRQTELDEVKKQVEIVEGQMRAVREEFEQSIGLLKLREGELKDTRERLQETETVLEERTGELQRTQVALEEETVVRQAHQETEVRLDGIATGLRTVVHDSVNDVQGLFDKLERKSAVLNTNSHAILTHGKVISSSIITMSRKLEDFVKISSKSTAKLRSDAKQFESKELDALAGYSDRVSEQLKRIQSTLSIIQTSDKTESDAILMLQTSLNETTEALRSGAVTWGAGLKQTCEAASSSASKRCGETFASSEKALRTMGNLVESMVQEMGSYIEAEREAVVEAKMISAGAATAEITRLRSQNAMLTRLLDEERLRGEKAKDDLLQRVSGLLGDFTKERDRGLREAVGAVQAENAKAEEGMLSFKRKHEEMANAMEGRGDDVAKKAEKWVVDGSRIKDAALKTLDASKAKLNTELSSWQSDMSVSLDSYSKEVLSKLQAMNEGCEIAFDNERRAKRARTDATTSWGAEVQSDFKYLQRGLGSTARNIQGIGSRVESEGAHLSSTTETYHSVSKAELVVARDATKSLAEEGTKPDLASGTTPKKRVFQFIDHWELTRNRDQVLQGWRSLHSGVSDQPEDPTSIPEISSPIAESRASSESPIPTSLASSAGSSVAPPPKPQIPVPKKVRSAAPPAPLVDARNFPLSMSFKAVVFLAMVLAVGFLMIILSHPWSLTFVLAPLPNALFSHCGSDEFGGNYDGGNSGPVDLGRFITAVIVTSGIALPVVLAHAEVIRTPACIMSVIGGGPMVYEEADPAASSHSQSTCPDYHPYSLHEFEPGPSRPFRLQWKLDREQTDRFHHEFWLESNTRFEQGKREALEQLPASASAIEKERALSEFYRVWHEREHLRTDAYTKEWRDRNKTSVTLATRVAWHTLVTRILGLLPFETSKTNKGRA